MTSSNPLPLKRLALIFILIVLLVRIVYYSATEGFCPDRVMVPTSEIASSSSPEEMSSLGLEEFQKGPFTYLKKGSQAYAFMSSDHQYVLKLFKRHHMQDPKWLESIPCFGPLKTWRNTLLEKRRKKLSLAQNSYLIATTRLKKQCGIVASQLDPLPHVLMKANLIDGIGRKHEINVAQCGFVLQRKASLVFPSFAKWIEEKDWTSAQAAIHSLLRIIKERSLLGIEDIDPDIHKNAGLVGTESLFIDIGSFTDKGKPLSKESFAYDLKKICNELKLFLQKKEPSLAVFLDQAIDEEIERYGKETP